MKRAGAAACDTCCVRRCPWQRPIPPAERLQLGPFAKWSKYRRFPCKFVLHVVLVICMTLHAVRYVDIHGTSSQPLGNDFARVLYPEDFDQYTGDATDFPYGVFRLFTVNQTVDAIHLMVARYFELPRSALARVAVPAVHGSRRVEPGLALSQFTATRFADGVGVFAEQRRRSPPATVAHTEPITNASWRLPCTPSPSGVKAYLTTVTQLQFDWTIKFDDPSLDDTIFTSHSCFVWRVTVVYDFTTRGSLTVTARQRQAQLCGGVPSPPVPTGLLMTTLVCCVAHIALSVRALLKLCYLAPKLLRAKAQLAADDVARSSHSKELQHLAVQRALSVTWDSLSWRQKASLVDVWRLLGLVADALTLIFCLVDLGARENLALVYTNVPSALLGGAVGLVWVSLLQYLEYDRRYYVLILTIKKAAPRILQVLIGVSPLLLAYALFGVAVFGYYAPRFGSLGFTLITLYSFMNGDAMVESFHGLAAYGNSLVLAVVGCLYLVSFMCLFAYLFIMALIAINEEAFFASREDGIDVHDGRKLPIMLRALLQGISSDTALQVEASRRVRERARSEAAAQLARELREPASSRSRGGGSGGESGGGHELSAAGASGGARVRFAE